MRLLATTDLPARQRGAALLILLAILSTAIIYAIVAGLNHSAGDLARARDLKTYAALAQAKAALIAYAVTYKDTHDNPPFSYTVPGYLPCPDLGSSISEGVAAANCTTSPSSTWLVSVMGRLPWKTLGLDALKDSSGECLWYAVSGTYKNNPNGLTSTNTTTTSNMMNWDTNGLFDVKDADGTSFVTGSTADTNAVAVIFAPGSALKPAGASAVQNRAKAAGTTTCGGNYTAANYLEGFDANSNNVIDSGEINNSVLSGIANGQDTFIAGSSSNTFNDKLVYITRADIWNAIKQRSDFNYYLRALTRRAAECTALYGTRNSNSDDWRLPWASAVALPTVPTYAVNASYDDTTNLTSGRLSFKVQTSDGITINDLPSNISDYGTTGAYIFTSGNPYCSYSRDQKIWYDNWKDQLFYAVGTYFRPGANWWQAWWSGCSASGCLTINGSANYAAVVIFAGDKLTNATTGQVTQPRNTAADKGTPSNYLEGTNAASISANTGLGTYQTSGTGFNDIVYAVAGDLSNLTVLCARADGSMRPVPNVPVAPPGTGNAGAYYTDLKNYAACSP